MTTRISGLASGLDIDKFVTDLIKARKTSRDSIGQKATQTEWKKTDLQSVYTAVSDFRKVAFDNTLTSALAPRIANSSDESVVIATPESDAASDAHALRVSQLAESVRLASSGAITADSNEKTTLSSQFGLTTDFDLVINDVTIAVDVDASINTLVSQINAADAGVVAKYDATLDRFFLASTSPGKYEASGVGGRIDFGGNSDDAMAFVTGDLYLPINAYKASDATITPTGNPKLTTTTLADQFGIAAATFNIVLNGQTIAVDTSTMTLDELMTAMSATATDVTAEYDRDLDRIFMESTNTGTAYDWTGTDAAGTTFLTDNLLVMSDDSVAIRGQDALVNYDGAELTIKDNTFDADGATYYLKGVSSSDVVVTIGVDTDKIVDNVKAFIESYNALITKVNGELKEERYKIPGNDYQYFMPLTDDQKADMSADEITLWEEKARSGLLRSNPILRGTISTFRNDVASPVSPVTTTGPQASMNAGSNSDGGTLLFDGPLYYRVGGTAAGELTALADGTDVSSMIQYTGTGTLTSATYRVNGDRSYIEFVTSTPAINDEFSLKTGGVNNLYNEDGEIYTPKYTYYKEGVWKYPKPESAYNSASSIGITTGQGDYSYYSEDGKLYLDEDLLRAALAADPEVVKRIFGSDGDTTSQMGVAQRLYASANNVVTQLAREAGVPGSVITNSALDRQLSAYYTEMDKIQERMDAEEERYYNMFNAMEAALNRLNTQSSWLAQQTGQSTSSG